MSGRQRPGSRGAKEEAQLFIKHLLCARQPVNTPVFTFMLMLVGANPAPDALALPVFTSQSSLCTPCPIPASLGSAFGARVLAFLYLSSGCGPQRPWGRGEFPQGPCPPSLLLGSSAPSSLSLSCRCEWVALVL